MRQQLRGGDAAALLVLFAFLLLLVFSSGCSSQDRGPGMDEEWKTTPLTDIRTGKGFSIADFQGQTVLIQTFTVTCPICMHQQAEITRLHASGDVPFVMVGLDIDPNSDTPSLLSYTEKNGYYGVYASSPTEMTGSLVRQFGMPILSPAQAPLLLVCPDGTTTLLKTGVKDAEYLRDVIRQSCPR